MVIRSNHILNHVSRSLRVGKNSVCESSKMVFLGVTVNNKLSWTDHGKNVTSDIRKVNGLLSRLAANVPRNHLRPVVHGLIISKVRYCIAAFATVRSRDTDPVNNIMRDLQLELNRAMRLVCGTKLSDRISILELIEKSKVPSINHIAAETILREIWRSRSENLPLADYLTPIDSVRTRTTRSEGQGLVKADKKNSFTNSLANLWNALPLDAKTATIPYHAYRIIKNHVKSTIPTL